ncbi:MAG TPA: acyl-CoA dehydrogenase [Dehalococcoidia bacterium]|nr:acyl-CoA dehydrogenase [Dehalococcoidia bacterium]
MDFRDTPEQARWRNEVRSFLDAELAPDWRGGGDEEAMFGTGRREVITAWRKKLAARGWIAPAWPKEYGGASMSIMEQFIFNEEVAKAQAPPNDMIGVGMVGPTLIVYGTEEQKKEHLGGILSGERWWCQLYSEPGAGSDLASLQTRAVRDGDDYVVNGQKIWTSGAHIADYGILLARTDPTAPKHKGISYFMVDMKSPGITVRPLVNMADNHSFNEVFFEDVRVPKKNMIGEENRGWYMAVTTLDFERSAIGGNVGMRRQIDELIAFAKEARADGRSTLDANPSLRYELADRVVEAEVAKMMSYRIVTMQDRGLIPNHEASCAKLFSSELSQRVAATGMHVLGLYGQISPKSKWAPLRGRIERSYLGAVSATIAGGTSEIQRNIIAQRGLGMPR